MIKNIVKKSEFLSKAFRNARDHLGFFRQPTMIKAGFMFSGNSTMSLGEFEPHETKLIEYLLKQIDVFVNVGANVGYYCCYALKLQKYVIAYEPLHLNQRLLLRNIKANSWEHNFELFPIALSDRIGILDIYGSGTGASLIRGWAGQNYSTLVPVSTMDLTLANRLVNSRTLVLVDVEGAEYMVLKGAKNMLEALVPPIWIVEVSVDEHQPFGVDINPDLFNVFTIFNRSGYYAITICKNPRLINIEEIERIRKLGINTLGTHNFLFTKDSNLVDDICSKNCNTLKNKE